MQDGRIISITDYMAPELDVYTRRSEGQLRHYFEPDGGLFIAESPIVITLALQAGCQPLSLLVPLEDIEKSSDLICRCGDIPVYGVSAQVLEQIKGFHMVRGAMCAMRRPNLPDPEALLAGAKRIAVLDNVENPTNVGAIMRSAAALHIDAVLLTEDCSDPLYRRAARVSMGTVFQIPWTYVSEDYIDRLKQLGYTTVAMALCDDSVSLDKLSGLDKAAIILGSEGYGLRQTTIEKCDVTVRIPMSHGVDSLNVAAASAVAFWQLRGGNI
ncbi:MAG: RNA methyltransferase [Clostridia bacterium]|nr:RNA methyltransferase [Clostridia bacterium]